MAFIESIQFLIVAAPAQRGTEGRIDNGVSNVSVPDLTHALVSDALGLSPFRCQ